ncbi:hypothetical protein B0A48_16957 [Cryoendolithus antarcticus]|uniref:Cora-domain-containing protein n=1 Tax=Cryoendolithus antarcticus TaxID=1507870 RepID=A0A1V8SD16_9PEZI|nr:hypothetical protein B0A48_16957 [Cryoendolithus antarcticus]
MAATGKDIERVAGPESMAMPGSGNAPVHGSMPDSAAAPKKKRHRAGKNRKKTRRQSFVAPSETDETAMEEEHRPSLRNATNGRQSGQQSSLYRIPQSNRSNTSLESQALLDHREHEISPNRRRSIQQSLGRPSMAYNRQQARASQLSSSQNGGQRSRLVRAQSSAIDEDEIDMDEATDRTPLLSRSHNQSKPEMCRKNSAQGRAHGGHNHGRRTSINSPASSQRAIDVGLHSSDKKTLDDQDYDVNNPPSVPSSPKIGTLDDVMVGDAPINPSGRGRDAIINIDYNEDDDRMLGSSPDDRRRHTVADLAEMDVCYPHDHDEHFSEAGDDEDRQSHASSTRRRRRKHRAHQWPVFDILDDWTREEKEERTQQEHVRAKKISEPVMVDGRLRPKKPVWHRTEDDAPFRFTYFNETFESTIHARTIGDLLQDGCTFPELFLPDPVEISESSESESECESQLEVPINGHANRGAPESSLLDRPNEKRSPSVSKSNTGTNTPSGRVSAAATPTADEKAPKKRQGERPTFWLDVLKPTEMEMKVLAKAFGIHQLTIEDIQMDEPREKVELFKKYYFVNYRSFEQDKDSEDYMEPVNMYAVVFHDGVITFHHTMTPHPANVRRRIRQLNDYLSPNADWISYALIDDITDAYAPLVQAIEDEVDDIDDEILTMHEDTMHAAKEKDKTKAIKRASNRDHEKSVHEKSEADKTPAESAGDMLRRVGECRKRVMGLYRLLGSKADVIKGFAKRCNEQWNVAPRSEIGLYLGDIQDHIVTMTGNLSHYESLLSRAHSNYLAQINVRMNERAEQTNDTLGKLTVLGTIVLPMNIITGMWGMNVWVPGQGDEGNLLWFWVITAGLIGFGLSCYFTAKRVYGIV